MHHAPTAVENLRATVESLVLSVIAVVTLGLAWHVAPELAEAIAVLGNL